MTATNFVIETERLKLRPFALDDVDALHAQWTEPGVRRFLWDDKIIARQTVEDIVRLSLDSFAEKGYGLWVLEHRNESGVIGFCGFRGSDALDERQIELLYGLSERWWGQGLAAEAAQAVVKFGFERCRFKQILAITDAPNTASVRVMEKAGMRFVKRDLYHNLDSIFYELNADG